MCNFALQNYPGIFAQQKYTRRKPRSGLHVYFYAVKIHPYILRSKIYTRVNREAVYMCIFTQ